MALNRIERLKAYIETFSLNREDLANIQTLIRERCYFITAMFHFSGLRE